jgi:DNA topoisomerase I
VSRIRRADPCEPGIRRSRRGRGFEYVDEATGERVADIEVVERIRELAIPPAWRDVWICPYPNGNI